MNEFQSTLWTLIRGAGQGDEAALRAFVGRYRDPVAAYCRRRGFAADADDLAQEVLIRLLQDGVLRGADPARGRFRSLLLAVTKHVIGNHVERETAQKRGAGRVEPLADRDLAAPAPDDDFDREWVAHLVRTALDRLAKERPQYHDALRQFLLEGRTYAEIAKATGCAESDVKNRVFRGKGKLVAFLREAVKEYSESEKGYEEELAWLDRMMPGG